jgi:DtxR family transcriptional regulator, Mn-dependent transcriptional regulator
MPTSTVEDYVKTLYVEQQRAPEQLVALATAMSVVPGTVTTMVRTLADAGLVRYEPRVGVSLTEAGEKLALHVLRRHRLVELFLVEVLKFDWSEVHDEAEELEHAMSDKLIERMDEFLGRPTVDPHGDPIPTASGTIERAQTSPLSRSEPGARVRIARIDNQDPAFLNYATANGLRPGAELTVVTADAVAGAVTVRTRDDKLVALGFAAADVILVCAA